MYSKNVFVFGLVMSSVCFAGTKEFSETESQRVKEEATYIMIRDAKDGTFSPQSDSKEVTDSEIVNSAIQKSIRESKKEALREALEECHGKYKNCVEKDTKVISTAIGDIDVDMRKFDEDRAVEIKKEIHVSAKVRVTVVGGENSDE